MFVDIDFSSRISALRSVGLANGVPANLLPDKNASISDVECLRWVNLQRISMSLPPLPGLDYNGFVGAVNDLAKAGGTSMGRPLLTADTSYYIATTGNDTTGDGSIGKPWATLQTAFNAIGKLDFGGKNVTLNVGAGTFVGGRIRYLVGGGSLQVNGAGSAQTIIAGGDATLSVYYCNMPVGFNRVTIKATSSYGTVVNIQFAQAGFGVCTDGNVPTDVVLDTGVGLVTLTFVNVVYNAYYQDWSYSGAVTIKQNGNASNWSAIVVAYNSLFIQQIPWNMTGTSDTWQYGFCELNNLCMYDGQTFTGTSLGPKFAFINSSVCRTSSNSGGLNMFPGSTPGTWDATCGYDGVLGVTTTAMMEMAEQKRRAEQDLRELKKREYHERAA